jgi:hypothetical protein
MRQAADLTEILSRNPDLLRRNPTLATEAGVKASHAVTVAQQPVQRRGRMNKLEGRYAREVLDVGRFTGEIVDYWFEPIRFRLAKSTNYTGDFVVQFKDGWELHEVKGYAWPAAQMRLKVVAEMKPFCLMFRAFKLCRHDKDNGWIITQISQ